MESKNKPFSLDYVINATKKHMLKSVDISIKKTIERIQEFSNDPEKSKEIFETLSHLDSMKRSLSDESMITSK
jgi:hypothetical protein